MQRKRKVVRPSARPEATGEMMGDLFRWLKLEEPARAYRVLRAFTHAVGPRISAHARAERVRGAILYVRVTSSAWSHELHILKEQLLSKLRRTPGGHGIQEMRFSVGPLDDLPDWAAGPLAEEPDALLPLVDPHRADLVAAVAEIADPELRADLSRLLERQAARKRPPSGS